MRMRIGSRASVVSLSLLALSGLALGGCHTDMWIQPKVKPLQQSDFFTDQASSRPVVPHTVARGQLRADTLFETGLVNDKLVTTLPAIVGKGRPFKSTLEMLRRGKDRFDIFCTPCHGALGDGKGMIAQRGLSLRREPASYHTDRLRKMPIGHFFDVMTNGYGVMYSYASRIETADRWAVAAYIRALQRSQRPMPGDVPEDAMRAPVPEAVPGSSMQ